MTKFLRRLLLALALFCGVAGGASAEVSPVCLTPAAELTETPEAWLREEYIREEIFTPRSRPSVIAEPGLLQVTGTMDTAAALTAYSWEGAAPVTLIGPWSGSGPAATTAGNSGASAEYAATLTPGAWRPSLKWPTVTTPATAVRVTLDLPGHPLETVVVNPGQQPGTALSLSGNRATTGGTARIRIGANVPATGTVGLPTLVWERKVTPELPAIPPVTVEPTSPTVATTAPTSAITLSAGAYRVLLPAPAGASGAYTQRVMLRATVTDPVTGKTDFAECAGGFTGVTGTVNLVHDADGRRTADVRHTNITWTPGGRVTSITLPSGIRVEDTHDAEGRRVRRLRHAASGETTSRTDTFWDGWSPIEEKEYDGVGVLLRTRRYLWGLDLDGSQGGMGHVGGLLALTDNGTLYLPAYDTAGHVIGLLDANGNVVANYEYGPFGEPLRETGPAALVCPFRWNTRYWDADTGFYYFGHRHYDAITGKWLSREPLGEGAGLNLFAYCHGDPVNHFDYLGLAAMLLTDDQKVYDGVLASKAAGDVWFKDVTVRLMKENIFKGIKEGSPFGYYDKGHSYNAGRIVSGDHSIWFMDDAKYLVNGVAKSEVQIRYDHLNYLNELNQLSGAIAVSYLNGVGAGSGAVMNGLAKTAMQSGVAPLVQGELNVTKTLWKDQALGVQVRQFGDWWVKRVNPNSNKFMKWWGMKSINAQYSGLQSLGDMATANSMRNGLLFTRNVGTTLPDGYRFFNQTSLNAYLKGSWRMKTLLNDIQPRNMGVNGVVFDPAIDPISKWAAYGVGGGTAAGTYWIMKPDSPDESNDSDEFDE